MLNTPTTNDGRPVAARGRALTIAVWLLQLLLAFQFAGAGVMKLSAAPVMVDMFATIGIGQWFRLLVGSLEIAAAIGLLIPRIAGLAALGLICLMLGATITSIYILHAQPWVGLVLLLLCLPIVWVRWSQIKTLAGVMPN